MKKIVTLIALLSLCLMIGCGKKEDIGGYSYNSYDADKTTNKDIYIEGELTSTTIVNFNTAPYLVGIVKEDKGKEWICKIGQAGLYTDEVLSEYIGRKIICFGEYVENVGNRPVLELHLKGDYCIRLASDKKENICNEDSLMATETSLQNWCDQNLADSIFKDIDAAGTPGTYKSTGIINRVNADKDLVSFEFYQKNNGSIVYSNIFDYCAAVYRISDFTTPGFKDGEAVTIYYIYRESSGLRILGFTPARVDFTLDEATDEQLNNSKPLSSKEYIIDDISLTHILFDGKNDNDDKHWLVDIKGVNENNTAYLYLLNTFMGEKIEELNIDYSVSYECGDTVIMWTSGGTIGTSNGETLDVPTYIAEKVMLFDSAKEDEYSTFSKDAASDFLQNISNLL